MLDIVFLPFSVYGVFKKYISMFGPIKPKIFFIHDAYLPKELSLNVTEILNRGLKLV